MSNVLVRDDSASCRRTMTDEEKAPYREKQRSIAQQLRNKRQVLDTPERTDNGPDHGKQPRLARTTFPWHKGCSLTTGHQIGGGGYGHVFEAVAWQILVGGRALRAD